MDKEKYAQVYGLYMSTLVCVGLSQPQDLVRQVAFDDGQTTFVVALALAHARSGHEPLLFPDFRVALDEFTTAMTQ